MNVDLFTYPASPGFKERDTSLAAACSMANSAAWLRTRYLNALREHGPSTADEIAGFLGLSILSVRPRFSELNHQHLIVDTGERRPNESGRSAKVWRAA